MLAELETRLEGVDVVVGVEGVELVVPMAAASLLSGEGEGCCRDD